jgi:dipeptidyl aminopeptidase/acylaminoacyl peptidase
MLLFGTYNDLRISTPTDVRAVKPPIEVIANGGYFAFPSISPKGDSVAWGFAVALDNRRRHQVLYKLGIYSVALHEWKTYGDFDDIGDTAFSRDGSKVALVALSGDNPELLIFDRTTESVTRGPFHRGMQTSAGLSWSPDGTRLAVVIEKGDLPVQIAVLDLTTGDLHVVGEGYAPAWSPSGEWIAYYAGDKCMIVRPDGTRTKTIKKLPHRIVVLRGGRSFNAGLVWSPDGAQLLLNEIRGDGPNLDVTLLDLPSGRSKNLLSGGLPVFGWASLKQH